MSTMKKIFPSQTSRKYETLMEHNNDRLQIVIFQLEQLEHQPLHTGRASEIACLCVRLLRLSS